MNFDLDVIAKISPVVSGLFVALVFWLYRWRNTKAVSLEDIFVIGITGSSFPSGVLFIAAAFNPSLLEKVSETPVYVALAGFAVLYIAVKTVKEKSFAA